jgi:hypothetical protein
MVLDNQLEKLGLLHKSYRSILIADMVSESYLEPLSVLTEVLQEDEMFNRLAIYHPQYYTTTPLNRIVDVALPESYVAYRFGQDVDLWIESEDAEARKRVISMLERWSANHERLAPCFENNERLLEVRDHSEHLSGLAHMALAALSDPATLSGKEDELTALYAKASKSYGATNLPITEHVQKLVNAAFQN